MLCQRIQKLRCLPERGNHFVTVLGENACPEFRIACGHPGGIVETPPGQQTCSLRKGIGDQVHQRKGNGMRQVAQAGDQTVMGSGRHLRDARAKGDPERTHPLKRMHITCLCRSQQAGGPLKEIGACGCQARAFASRHRVGSDELLSQERLKLRNHAGLHASCIGDDGAGGKVRGDGCSELLHRADRGAEDHQISICDGGCRIGVDSIGQTPLHDLLKAGAIASPDGDCRFRAPGPQGQSY